MPLLGVTLAALQSLFREWLVTRSEAPELWEPLGEAMFKLTDWKDLVMVCNSLHALDLHNAVARCGVSACVN